MYYILDSVLHTVDSVLHAVEDKIKFWIPFCRTAVTWLKMGGKGMLFGNNQAFHSTVLPFQSYSFTACLALRNLKNCLSNKIFQFFLFTGSWGGAFWVNKIEAVLFKVVSRRIVSSTTAQYWCFLDVKVFSGLDLFTTESPSVANRLPMKCGPGYSCVPAETSVWSFIEAS